MVIKLICCASQDAALKRVAAPAVVHNAISGAVAELGWQGLDDVIGKAPAGAGKGGKKAAKEDGADKGDKKEKRHRAIGPYMLFMSIIMDRINKDPEHPAFKVGVLDQPCSIWELA